MLSLGLAGCAREALDVAKDDPNAQSAAEERAADAVARSREALADQDRRAKAFHLPNPITRASAEKKTKGATLAAEEPKPSLSERLLGGRLTKGLFDRKSSSDKELSDDPFVAGDEKSEKTREAAKKSPSASDDALDKFLREQEPVTARKRASVVNYEEAAEDTEAEAPKKTLARKPGTQSEKASFVDRKLASDQPASAKSPTDKRVAAKTPATAEKIVAKAEPKKSAARPFPTANLLNEEPSAVRTVSRESPPVERAIAKSTPKSTTTLKPKQHPLAARTESAEARPSSAQSAKVGAKIANLMGQSRTAAEEQRFSEALKLAAEAQRLAAANRYSFKKGEDQPVELMAWLAVQMEESADEDASAKTSIAKSKVEGQSPFATASWSNDADFAAEPVVARDPQPASIRNSLTITEGRRSGSIARERTTVNPPAWPMLTSQEFQKSDELWQPVTITADHLERADSKAAIQRPLIAHATINAVEPQPEPQSPWESQPAKAETIAATTPAAAPLVELGNPTTTMPEKFVSLVASDASNPATSSRRIAPPPLAISSDSAVAAETETADLSVSSGGSGRAVWYVVLGAILTGILIGFRRKIYGGKAS